MAEPGGQVKGLDPSPLIVGESAVIAELRQTIDMVARTNATVLVLGETGTGKELVARAIHAYSPRAPRPFSALNCAALPPTLADSELFGHDRGAFTGAHVDRPGRFESAEGGTLFLDEVGELSTEAQAKLLRILQERTLERIGSTRSRSVDVRVVAATNRNLARSVADGKFRADLFYRLNVFPIQVPPLRKRASDIPILANHFLVEAAARLGKRLHGFTESALVTLVAHSWPGNVRELRNIVERAAILAQGTRIGAEECTPMLSPDDDHEDTPVRLCTLVEAERLHILRALERTRWVIEGASGAANVLGVNASTLRSKMRKLGISRRG
ncbi:MAG: sigma-54-dependent Fis family transcriptional regulator [Polyangiaceae bacterium]|nr:sigma-54-dependent Fis family transcriptional regulator [Polyangiaceae bacterium]